MSTPTAEGDPRRRADAVRNRQRVLDATKALLAEGGSAVTVEAISRRAAVGAATVVRSFGGKDALIDAAVTDLLGPVIQRAREALRDTDAVGSLRDFLLELIAFQSAHWIIGEQLRGLDLPATTAQRAALTRAVLDLVARARDDGAIRTDLDPAQVAVMVEEMTHAIARSPAASPELARGYVTVLMDGLAPRP